MKFIIHFTTAGNIEDTIIIEEDSIEEVKKQADEEIQKRGGSDPWSEEIK